MLALNVLPNEQFLRRPLGLSTGRCLNEETVSDLMFRGPGPINGLSKHGNEAIQNLLMPS